MERLLTSASTNIGARFLNEDTFVCSNDILPKIFAIFDGHGGTHISSVLKENFVSFFISYWNKMAPLQKTEEEKIIQIFIDFDAVYCQFWNKCGSTAIVVIILEQKTFVANVGDSEAIVCRENAWEFCETLSKSHNAQDEEEKERIVALGGTVERGRVNSMLSVTRSFGDVGYLGHTCDNIPHRLVIPTPHVASFCNNVPFLLILGSDGLFDHCEKFRLRDRLSECIGSKWDPDCAGELVRFALECGSRDNITAIVIAYDYENFRFCIH